MKVRRIVTGKNKENHSMVKWDSEIEARPGRSGFERADIWATKSLPAKLSEEDPAKWELGTSALLNNICFLLQYFQ